jgi:uncharacterized membrane protein (UPF0127 family)
MISLILAAALNAPQHLPIETVRAPKAVLTLQIAKSDTEHEIGLMYVTKLYPHNGMVFVFDTDGPEEFWMKNTLIPLDMVYVAADGTVRKVFTKVPVVSVTTPDDRIPRRQGNAKYVIELPAGEATKDGIVPGVKLSDVTITQ